MIWFILIFAAFLRFIHFPALSWFKGDQGVDLLISQRVLQEGIWPLAGPYLSVSNFFVPPVYYWILTPFLWLGRSPEVVSALFVCLDLLTLVVFYRFVSKAAGTRAGLIAAAIYSISYVMVDHGRSMWQPHPVQFFLICGLYALYLVGQKQSRVWMMYVSWICYGIALAVYPSPLPLLPLFIFHTIQFLRRRCWSVQERMWILGVSLLSFIAPYIPSVIFETTHGNPTFNSLFNGSFGSINAWITVRQLLLNLSGLFSTMTGIYPMKRNIAIVSGLLFFFVFYALFAYAQSLSKQNEKLHGIFSFISIPMLCIGFVFLMLFRGMGEVMLTASHRLYGFIPIVFIMLSLIADISLRHRNTVFRMLVTMFIGFFVVTNVHALIERDMYVPERSKNRIDTSRQIARLIDISSRLYAMKETDFSVIAYSPVDTTSYSVTPELFFLREMRTYSVPFTEAGNDIDRTRWGHDNRPYIYVLCKLFPDVDSIERGCIKKFEVLNPKYKFIRRVGYKGDTTVILFTRK